VDLDAEIVKAAGKEIPQIFEEIGEGGFRQIETEVATETAKRNHTVISCGGGIVKNEINMHALSLNGFVVYIDRRLEKLAIGGDRPLSKDAQTIKKLKQEREPLYKKYSDAVVENNGHFNTALEKLLEVWNENTGY
ncbi:MAG: shikimate kinase, partial [Clostridia bacterium]|nr:shikimate kinase [Clostridia bacterium]